MRKPVFCWNRTLQTLQRRVNWQRFYETRRSAPSRQEIDTLRVTPLESRQVLSASIGNLALSQDTGDSATDKFTTNGIVVGQVTGIPSGGTVTVQVDVNADSVADFTLATTAAGSQLANFEFDPSQYYQLSESGQKSYSFRAVTTTTGGGGGGPFNPGGGPGGSGGSTTYSSWSSFSYFLSPQVDGHLEISSPADSSALGQNRSGIAVDDAATGKGFILYSVQDVHQRFSSIDANNSDHLIAVRWNQTHAQWEYNNGQANQWSEFIVRAGDRLVAEVDFDQDTIASLKGKVGELNGLDMGFDRGDLVFAADRWGGVVDDGEFQITGTAFEVDSVRKWDAVMTGTGNLGSGVGIDDNATGTVFIMYSEQSVHQRFSSHAPDSLNSDHLIAVRYNYVEEYWEYSNNALDGWFEFSVKATDRLLAEVDLRYGVVQSLKGTTGTTAGISRGYSDGDLVFEINRWGGQTNPKEVQVTGTAFSIAPFAEPNAVDRVVFKDISVGSQTTRTIQLRNTGARSIQVSDIVLPFGFSVVDFEEATLTPGATVSIVLAMNGLTGGELLGELGLKTTTNNTTQITSFELEGEVHTPKVEFKFQAGTASSRLDFGVLQSDQTVQKTIVVTNVGTAAISLESDIDIPEGFTLVSGLSSTELDVGQSATLIVSATGTGGALKLGSLQLYLADQILPFQSVELFAEVNVPRIEVTTDGVHFDSTGGSADFGALIAGNQVDRTFVIKNTGVQPLDISQIELPNHLALVTSFSPISLATGQTFTFSVRMTASVAAAVAGSIKIHSNDPTHDEMEIETRGAILSVGQPKLLNDTGMGMDGVSSDPRIVVSLGSTPIHVIPGEIIAHIDDDGDGQADFTRSVSSNRFILDPEVTASGAFTRAIRIEVHNSVTNQSTFSNWQSYTGTYDPTSTNAAPVLSGLSLGGTVVNGTQTTLPVIKGTVTNDGAKEDLVVVFDFNGDQKTDASTTVRADGTFEYVASELPLGLVTVSAKVVETTYSGTTLTSNAQSIFLQRIPYPAPTFNSVSLKQDSGASGTDKVTSISTIIGQLSVGDAAGRYVVVWDTVADGSFERSVVANATGQFEFQPTDINVGAVTIYLKAVDTLTQATSSATTFAFTLVGMQAPTMTSFQLLNDTGAADGITSDPTVAGSIAGEWGIDHQKIELDWNSDGVVDATTYTNASGAFQYVVGKLPFGLATVKARTAMLDVVTTSEVYGAWQSVSFTYQKTLDIGVNNFHLTNGGTNNQSTKPILAGTAKVGSNVTPFSEIEFDYNGDNTPEATLIADANGEFSHFADTALGQVTVRARARQFDAQNGQYYYGAWSNVTFTRQTGVTTPSNQTAIDMSSQSSATAGQIADAITALLTDARGQFNAPGDNGSGFNLGHVRLAVGSVNDSLDVNANTNTSLTGDNASGTSFLVRGTGLAAGASRSGAISIIVSTSVFSVNGTLSYTLTNSGGSALSFSYDLTFSLSTATVDDAFTGQVLGSFTSTSSGSFDFSESVELVGINQATQSDTVGLHTELTITGGTIQSNGNVSYTYSRTEAVDHQAALNHQPLGATGTSTIAQTGTYTESGTVGFVLAGGSTATKSVSRSYTSAFVSDVTRNTPTNQDGSQGTIGKEDDDSYSLVRTEVSNYSNSGSGWTFTGGTFTETVTGSTSDSGSFSGTYTTRNNTIGADLGSSGSSVNASLLNTFTITQGYEVSETFSSTVNATITVGIGGALTTTATFSASGSQTFHYWVSMTSNSSSSSNGTTVSSTSSRSADLLGQSSFTISGSYVETATSFTGTASGSQNYSADLTADASLTESLTSPTVTKNSSMQGSLTSGYSSSGTFQFTIGANGTTNSGTYSIELDTSMDGSGSESINYTGHQVSGSALTGSESVSYSFSDSYGLTESGEFSSDGTKTEITGDFDKSGSSSGDVSGQSNFSYSQGNSQSSISTTYSSESSGTSTDSGSFTIYRGGNYQLASMAGQSGEYSTSSNGDPSVITGNFTNSGSISGETFVSASFSDSNSSYGSSSSSSGTLSTTTDYSGTTQDSGTYTITGGVRTGSGSYEDSYGSTSTTNSTFQSSSSFSGAGPVPVGLGGSGTTNSSFSSTDSVTTTGNFSESGSYTDSATSTSITGNFESTVSTSGTSTATVAGSGPNSSYGGTSTTQYTSDVEESGTTTTHADPNAVSGGGVVIFGVGSYNGRSGSGTSGQTSRTGEFSASSSAHTTSSDFGKSKSVQGRESTSSSYTSQSVSNLETTDDGSYSLAANGSGSRVSNFTSDANGTTNSSSTASKVSTGGPSLSQAAAGGGSTGGYSSGSESKVTVNSRDRTTIHRTSSGVSTTTYAVGGTSQTVRQGSFQQTSSANNDSDGRSTSSSWSSSPDSLHSTSDTSNLVSTSWAHGIDSGSFLENANGRREEGSRQTERTSQARLNGSGNSSSSSADGSSSYGSYVMLTTSSNRYSDNGTYIELNGVNISSEGGFYEASSTTSLITEQGAESHVSETGVSSNASNSNTRQASSSFNVGTFSNTGTTDYERSGSFNENSSAAQKGQGTFSSSYTSDGRSYTSNGEWIASSVHGATSNGTFTDSNLPSERRRNYTYTSRMQAAGQGTETESFTSSDSNGNSKTEYASNSAESTNGQVNDNGQTSVETAWSQASGGGNQTTVKEETFTRPLGPVNITAINEMPLELSGPLGTSNKVTRGASYHQSSYSGNSTVTITNSTGLGGGGTPMGGGTYTASVDSESSSTSSEESQTATEGAYDKTITSSGNGVTSSSRRKGSLNEGTKESSKEYIEESLSFSAAGNGDGGSIGSGDYTSYSLEGEEKRHQESATFKNTSDEYSTSTTYPGGGGPINPGDLDPPPGDGGSPGGGGGGGGGGGSYTVSFNQKSERQERDGTSVDYTNSYSASSPTSVTDDWEKVSHKFTESKTTTSGSKTGPGLIQWDSHYNSYADRSKTESSGDSPVFSKEWSNDWHSHAVYSNAPSEYSEGSNGGTASSDDGTLEGWWTGVEGWWAENEDVVLDWIQEGLNILGYLPVIGAVFDVINAGISFYQKDYLDAAINLAGAIPGIGDLAMAAKMAGKAADAAGAVNKVGGAVSRMTSNATHVGSQSLGMGTNSARRAGNFASAAEHNVNHSINFRNVTPQCFVGDTRVLVYEEVPSMVAASFVPITITENMRPVGGFKVGAWVALSLTGIVIVLAKKPQRKSQRLSMLRFAPAPEPAPNWETIPVLDEEQISKLLATAQFSKRAIEAKQVIDVERLEQPVDSDGASKVCNKMVRSLFDKPSSSSAMPPIDPSSDSMSDGTARDRVALHPDPRRDIDGMKLFADLEDHPASVVGLWGGRAVLAAACLAMLFWFSGLFSSSEKLQSNGASLPLPAQLASLGALSNEESSYRIEALRIEEIRVGRRVPAHNPQITEAQRASQSTQVDPLTWRTFSLEIDKQDGSGKLEVTLLRPSSWLVDEMDKTQAMMLTAIAEGMTDANSINQVLVSDPSAVDLFGVGAEAMQWLDGSLMACGADPFATAVKYTNHQLVAELASVELGRAEYAADVAKVQSGDGVGSFVYLTMPELGAVGLAKVIANEAAPVVKEGPGEIVTATFRHKAAQVLDLTFERATSGSLNKASFTYVSTGSLESSDHFKLGVTSAHPFWSVDREDFVPAGELREYERVVGIEGQEYRLTSITPRDGPETVYNFEVANEHVYYVGDGGLLVHNSCTGARLGGKLYDSGKLKRLEKYLSRRGIKLQVGDEFIPKGKVGGFSRDGSRLILRSNPTQYEVWHELAHLIHFQRIGKEAYINLIRTKEFNAAEQFVFDVLEGSKKRWNALSAKERWHAIDYIERVGFR